MLKHTCLVPGWLSQNYCFDECVRNTDHFLGRYYRISTDDEESTRLCTLEILTIAPTETQLPTFIMMMNLQIQNE